MTKRHSGYIVVLETDVREDDAQEIMAAIRMIKGVVAVQPVVSDPHLEIVENRRDIAWRAAIRRLSNGGPPKI
jgi:hypothetical protein